MLDGILRPEHLVLVLVLALLMLPYALAWASFRRTRARRARGLPGPVGIGGWLLVLVVLLFLLALYDLVLVAGVAGAWRLVAGGLGLWSLASAALLLKGHRLAPRSARWLLVADLAAFFGFASGPGGGQPSPSAGMGLVNTILFIFYLSRSDRVRATYATRTPPVQTAGGGRI